MLLNLLVLLAVPGDGFIPHDLGADNPVCLREPGNNLLHLACSHPSFAVKTKQHILGFSPSDIMDLVHILLKFAQHLDREVRRARAEGHEPQLLGIALGKLAVK